MFSSWYHDLGEVSILGEKGGRIRLPLHLSEYGYVLTQLIYFTDYIVVFCF